MVILNKLSGLLNAINSYGSQSITIKRTPVLQIGCYSLWEYDVFISPVLENILGIDILQGQTLQISVGKSTSEYT